MVHRDYVDRRSLGYAFVLLLGVPLYVFGSPPPGEVLLWAPLVVEAGLGFAVPVRERVPHHRYLLPVGLGVLGVYGLATSGLSLRYALFALTGVSAVATIAYERTVGRSVRPD